MERLTAEQWAEVKGRVAAAMERMGANAAVPQGAASMFEFDAETWAGEYYRRVQPLYKSVVAAGGKLAARDFKDQTDLDVAFDVSHPQTRRAIEKYTRHFASKVVQVDGNDLRKAIDAAFAGGESLQQLSKRIAAIYEEKRDYRSDRIARTEVIRGLNQGAVETWKQAADNGVTVHKEWLASTDACEFCLAMNGKILSSLDGEFLGMGQTFAGTEGGTMSTDYMDVTGPPLHPQCRCTVLPVVVEG